jgi:hypothetical protein
MTFRVCSACGRRIFDHQVKWCNCGGKVSDETVLPAVIERAS